MSITPPSKVSVHSLNFTPELDRIIPHLRKGGEIEWISYGNRATYGYVNCINYAGIQPEIERYVITTEGVGSKKPIDSQNPLEIPWYGQNGFFECLEPWTFAADGSVKTSYINGLEEFEDGIIPLNRFIYNKDNLKKWEDFFSTKTVMEKE